MKKPLSFISLIRTAPQCDPHVPCAAWSEPISQSVVECAVMSLLVKAARYAQCMMLVQWLINIMSPHGLHVLTYRVDCVTLRPFPLKHDSCIPSHLRISTSSTSSFPRSQVQRTHPGTAWALGIDYDDAHALQTLLTLWRA